MTRSRPCAAGSRRRATARRASLAASLAAGALVLAACHGLPTSTPVTTGLAVGREESQSGLRVVPRGPVAGSSPQDLVRDFLRAGVAADDDSGVAREYLTSTASAQWQPDGSAWIYAEQPGLTFSATKDGVVTVRAPVVAQLDSEGHYLELPPGQVRSLTLRLTRQGGQWRIDQGLDKASSTLISRADLNLYQPYQIVYSSPTDEVAVTDQRWFLQGSGLLTRLARAQLAQPPSYLQGAVLTGVPEYTDLAIGAVAVQDGVAKVGLNVRALNADDDGRRLMWRQLGHTLTQAPGVTSIQLEADGSRLSVSGLPDRPLSSAELPWREAGETSGPVLLRSRTGLERVDPAQLSERRTRQGSRSPAGPVLPKLGPEWFRLALSPDGAEIAALGGDLAELSRWRGGTHVQVRGIGRELTRPAYDRQGYLWLAGRTDNGPRIFVQPTADMSGAAPASINVPWLADRTIVAVRPAPEGQRVLVVSEPAAGGRSTVSIAGVLRKDGRPVGLASPISVAGALTDVVDATWLDPDTIGVVGRSDPEGDHHVVVAPIGGPSQTLGAVTGPAAITTFGGTRNIVVMTRRGTALVRSGNGFVPLVQTSDVVVPGR